MINCPYIMTVKQMKKILNEFSENDTVCLYCQAAPYKAIAVLNVSNVDTKGMVNRAEEILYDSGI